ncbi:R3H domain-containing nucleic acid-binding protein [Leifsonia sp. NPDC080035]|uniref:R3H domain-containing nucleic acid-binding protein n=1 Tax=Leifsonia sp. NPDC080035 TaxID=3143936 RepID=A0AAU7GDX3_9MICO
MTDVQTEAGAAEADAVDHSPAADEVQPTVADLDREGDIAADYIEELLDIADIDGDIDIDTRNGRAYISVNAEDGANLQVLSKPETVAALQELTRLAVQNKTGQFSRLILDIAGSRDARQAELAQLVDRAIAKLDEGAAQASLPPMSSYERKLVHDIVSERGYVSTSHGEGRDRYTVITAA